MISRPRARALGRDMTEVQSADKSELRFHGEKYTVGERPLPPRGRRFRGERGTDGNFISTVPRRGRVMAHFVSGDVIIATKSKKLPSNSERLRIETLLSSRVGARVRLYQFWDLDGERRDGSVIKFRN